MTNQGEKEAIYYTTITNITNITTLLTALTAYHCSRPDLACSPTAFFGPITTGN